MNIILIYFAIKYVGHWDKIYEALEKKEEVKLIEIQKLERKIKNRELTCITILDIDYPKQLKNAYKPPFVIFYEGNKDILQGKFISATGDGVTNIILSRIVNSIREIEKNYSIVSSLYKGVDQKVFSLANKNIMFVSANGVRNPYFAEKFDITSKKILVISEYPSETKISVENLRSRNRIVAAFAESLILYSSKRDGGIMNLVTNFLDLGKEVYVYPGDGSKMDGNSELIKSGANLITSVKDFTN